MAKDSRWTFDKSHCKSAAMKVDLMLTRLKNPKTHREQLRFTIIENGKDAGVFVCSPADIEGGLQSLREYGVMIQRSDKMDIRNLIDLNYAQIDILKLDDIGSMEEEVSEVYEYLCGRIIEEMEKAETKVFFKLDTYNVPVTTVFNHIMSESIYTINLKYLRERLAQLGLTECDQGRTTRKVRLNDEDGKSGDPITCISFKRKAFEDTAKRIGVSFPVPAVTEQ